MGFSQALQDNLGLDGMLGWISMLIGLSFAIHTGFEACKKRHPTWPDSKVLYESTHQPWCRKLTRNGR